MRGVFGLLGLLLVVAIVGLLVRKQFESSPVPQAPGAAVSAPMHNPAQQSRQIQEQYRKDLEKALQPARVPADP